MVANSGKPNIEDYKQHVRFGSKAEMLIASNVFRFAPNSEYDTPSLGPGIGLLDNDRDLNCNSGKKNEAVRPRFLFCDGSEPYPNRPAAWASRV
ncbi:MAG: hypothetical protein QOD11_1291 [Bradyrhizobium sp.]|nr:hypothetical protein [Bradyrhizobium sp.]